MSLYSTSLTSTAVERKLNTIYNKMATHSDLSDDVSPLLQVLSAVIKLNVLYREVNVLYCLFAW